MILVKYEYEKEMMPKWIKNGTDPQLTKREERNRSTRVFYLYDVFRVNLKDTFKRWNDEI